MTATSYNTTYTLLANVLALKSITPFRRNVVYVGTINKDEWSDVDQIFE